MGEVAVDASAFRELVRAGDDRSRADALYAARALSVAEVEGWLDYDFLDENAEQASAFLQEWLRQLRPYERVTAADWVSSQHILALVHLEGSWGTAAQVLVESYSGAVEQLATDLQSFRPLTEGPDAEASPEVADQLERLSEELRGIGERLRTVVKALESERASDEG